MKFGTIGTSWITESFIEAALETSKWELAAVYSRSRETAEAWGDQYGCQAFTDVDKLSTSGIEAVYIASPNALHFEQAMTFLSQGVHVICEKPMFTEPEQFEEARALAEKKGVFLFEAFRHIHSAGFDVIADRLREIAPVRNAIFSYNQYSSRYAAFLAGKTPNVFNPAFAGGALMDLGVYPISLAAALWGMPESIQYTPLILHNGVDGAGSVILGYGDFFCSISFSKITEGRIESEILGEKGAIVFDRPAELSSIRLMKEEAEDTTPPLYALKLQGEAERIADIIETGDRAAYERLLEISRTTGLILDRCRNHHWPQN